MYIFVVLLRFVRHASEELRAAGGLPPLHHILPIHAVQGAAELIQDEEGHFLGGAIALIPSGIIQLCATPAATVWR